MIFLTVFSRICKCRSVAFTTFNWLLYVIYLVQQLSSRAIREALSDNDNYLES